MDNYSQKTAIIKKTLNEIKKRKEKHFDKYRTLKLGSTVMKTIINSLNGVSVCSLVLAFTQNYSLNIVALSATSLSSIASAAINAYELENKVQSHHTSYLQYSDIYREQSARLHRNGLTSLDLDSMLGDLNAKLGLIEDQSLPVFIEPSPKASNRNLI